MSVVSTKSPWSTADEMQWIKTLGTHNEHINNPPYDDLLRRYLEATKKRKSWDGIDKRTVIAYAKKQLLKQERLTFSYDIAGVKK